jgi:hypothetical protein
VTEQYTPGVYKTPTGLLRGIIFVSLLAFQNDPCKGLTFSTALLTLIISSRELVSVLHLSKFVQHPPPSAYFKRSSETSVNISNYNASRRSQWPCDLRHELSSSARTLESWVRIPLEV